MASGDEDRGELGRRGDGALLLAGCARLYGALLVLYPRAFRHRYGAEMRRDFRELSQEGLAEGGARGLAGVLAVGISDLALTALAEWSSAARRRGALPWSVDLRMAARAMAAALLATVFVSAFVTLAGLFQTPVYEASALLLVGERSPAQETGNGKIQLIPNAPAPGVPQDLTDWMAAAIETPPVAEGAIRRLGEPPWVTPDTLLDNLRTETEPGTPFVRLTYDDSNPKRAQQVANAIGQAASEKISEVSLGKSGPTLTLWSSARLPEAPVSPNPLRNGLIALVGGLVLCAGLALVLLVSSAANIAGGPGGRTFLRRVGRARVPAAAPATGRGVGEGTREMELLRALGRRGKLTALGAALETSLSMGEAEWMLQALAAKGQLEVTVEQGRLLYSLWEGEAPP